MPLPRRPSLGLLALALPFALTACDGGGDSTSSAGGGGSGGTASGGTGGMASGGSTSSSSTDSTGGGGSGGSGGSGGAGGSAPTGIPFVYAGAGDGKIRVFTLGQLTGSLFPVQEIDAGGNPSFLAFAPDGKSLYAADESADELESFSINPFTGQLTFLNSVPSNGGGPAHVAVDATGKYVFGANYGGGTVTMVAANADGSLGAEVTTLTTGANAHELVLDPSNQFAFVPNLGPDTVSQLVFDAGAGTLDFNQPASISLPAGAGPRHMVFHPSAPFAYVIHETDDAVTAFPYDAQTGKLGTALQTISTLPNGVDGSTNTCAEIAFGASGKYLYGSNRGNDSIVIFSVDAQTGMMTLVGHQPTGGSTPRHFSIEAAGEFLLVGNQNSNEIRTFHIDPDAGTLTELQTIPLPAGPEFVAVKYID